MHRYHGMYLHRYRWHGLLFLGYQPVEHVAIVNTVGTCHMVAIIYLARKGTVNDAFI